MPPTVAEFIDEHVRADHGSNKHLLDAVIPLLPAFLATRGIDDIDDNEGQPNEIGHPNLPRPLVIYDDHGNHLFRQHADNYEEAIVLRRGGLNADNFWIIVPPKDFAAPERIPIPMEQKTEWGPDETNIYRTAYIPTDGNSLYKCISVLKLITTRSALTQTVQSLNEPDQKPQLITEVVQTPPYMLVRTRLADWLQRHHNDVVQHAIDASLAAQPLETLTLNPKSDATITDEEVELAQYYLSRDAQHRWSDAVTTDKITDIPEDLAPIRAAIASSTHGQVTDIVAASPYMVWSVNRFYADVDLGPEIQPLPDQENPLLEYPGERELPLRNFFTNDIRPIEAPFASDLDARQEATLAVLPPGPPIHIAGIGGGMANAYAAMHLAKIANASRRKIVCTVYEACPNIHQFGRFLSYIFESGLVGEFGAMRMAATSIPWFALIEDVLGPFTKAKTFPNQHVVTNFFILHKTYGQRGQGAAPDGEFKTVIEPTLNHIRNAFRAVSTTVADEVITFGDILEYLLTNRARTPNRSHTILTAFVKIAYEHNKTLDTFIHDAIADGLATRTILSADEDFIKIVKKPRETPGALTEAEQIILSKMAEERRIGGATAGWDDYGDLALIEQFTNETIGPYDEYDFAQLNKTGLQDLGRLMRDKARNIGGQYFTLNWEYGKSVIGLGKGSFDPDTGRLQPSTLLYRTIDPTTQRPVEEVQLRDFHFAISTVSPAVLARTVAPQASGTNDIVVLKGHDARGIATTRTCTTPFKVFTASRANLRRTNPALTAADDPTQEWKTAHMFNATKIMFTAPAALWAAISPKDQHFPGSGAPTIQDVAAEWALIPTDLLPQLEKSLEFIHPGTENPTVSAKLQFEGTTCQWVCISKYRWDALPADHPAKQLTNTANERNFLPICKDRLAELAVDPTTTYGDANHISTIDDEEVVWAPVAAQKVEALETDDPIRKRTQSPLLKHQAAVTYVVPESFVTKGNTNAIPPQYLAHATRIEAVMLCGTTGLFCNVPRDRVEEFESQFTSHSRYRLTDQDIPKPQATPNDVYRLATAGPVPRAFQLPGSSPAVYVKMGQDECLVLDYQWSRGANKSGIDVRSDMTPDTSDHPVEQLIEANNYQLGADINPLAVLAANRIEQASFSFSNSNLYYGAFSALGANDFAKSWPVQQYYKLALLWKYNPGTLHPPVIQPAGEHANINAGWIGPVLKQSMLNVASFAAIFGGRLSPTAIQSFMAAPPVPGLENLAVKPYPSFGLRSEEHRLSKDFPW